MFLPGYLKSRVEQFYSDLPGLLITGDNERTSRWEILHRKITRPWKGKLLGLGGSPSFRALLAPRISRGHFFLANFFRVTHDGLSERGTTRSLLQMQPSHVLFPCCCSYLQIHITVCLVVEHFSDLKKTWNCYLKRDCETAPNTATMRMIPGNSHLKNCKFKENHFFPCVHILYIETLTHIFGRTWQNCIWLSNN